MRIIYFNDSDIRSKLLINEVKYTLRLNPKQTGWYQIVYGNRYHPIKTGKQIYIETSIPIQPDDLTDILANEAGFKSVKQWLNQVKKLNRLNKLPDTLYLIKLGSIKDAS